MNIMTRDGKRGSLAGFTGGDPESPPLLFAIASLREVQWEVVPVQSGNQRRQDQLVRRDHCRQVVARGHRQRRCEP
ncbi:hypothetical protein ACU4GD_06275 [Cupriavidus basilensis]